MFKTPMNETDIEVDAALPRLTLPFFKVSLFALTSDLFSVFLYLNGVSCPAPFVGWFLTINLLYLYMKWPTKLG